MNAEVFSVFSHVHNLLEVARQEYAAAKEHFHEVCKYRNAENPEHNQRFLDAIARREVARDRYVELLTK